MTANLSLKSLTLKLKNGIYLKEGRLFPYDTKMNDQDNMAANMHGRNARQQIICRTSSKYI